MELDSVSFGYAEDIPVLRDVSISLAPGRVPFEYCFAITMMAQPLAWFEASGLPFVIGMAPFVSMRGFEQIRDDCAYNRNNVKIIAPFAGLEAGPWGATHHAIEDIALLRSIPGMTILSPADSNEAHRAVRAAADPEAARRLIADAVPSAVAAILQGYHPGFFHAYIKPAAGSGEVDARHNREYTPNEVARLLADAGFEVERLETGPFVEKAEPEHAWVSHLLRRYLLPDRLRGDDIFAVARKAGAVRERYPAWLYQ